MREQGAWHYANMQSADRPVGLPITVKKNILWS